MVIENCGKVYLVGAGPGDPGLITLKAVDVLKQADIVFYDYLVNSRLLDYCQSSCHQVYVGKRGNFNSISQAHISEKLIEEARKNKKVVRLKGGDPFLFGRGGEEAQALAQAKVPFEIIPGVSSLVSVPAYSGIPLTHRDFTSEVAIITGHRPENYDLKWDHIASFRTIIIFMGTAELERNLSCLMSAGLNPNTPAALIRWGTYNYQQTLVSSIQDLYQDFIKQDFRPPALLIIGEVVNLRENLNWFESRPLFGQKILLTRSSHQSSNLMKLLEEKGAEVISVPMIEISPLKDLSHLDNSINQLDQYSWLFFTSQNSVEIFWQRLNYLGFDNRALSHLKIGVVGQATAQKIKEKGAWVDLYPKTYHAKALANLCRDKKISGKKVLFPRAMKGRDDLVEMLKSLDCEVDLVAVYQNLKPNITEKRLGDLLNNHSPDWIIFTSSSTVNHFIEIIGKNNLEFLKKIKLACFGPITKQSLISHQLEPALVPDKSTIEDLVESLITYHH